MPLVYSEGVVKRGLPLTWMARVLGENPARMFGLHPRKGSIRVGADADLLIWDPTAKGEIHVADHRGIAGWTPLRGLEDHRPPLDDPPPRPDAYSKTASSAKNPATANSSTAAARCPHHQRRLLSHTARRTAQDTSSRCRERPRGQRAAASRRTARHD